MSSGTPEPLRHVGVAYDAEAAEDAWRRIEAFFATHLRGQVAAG